MKLDANLPQMYCSIQSWKQWCSEKSADKKRLSTEYFVCRIKNLFRRTVLEFTCPILFIITIKLKNLSFLGNYGIDRRTFSYFNSLQ